MTALLGQLPETDFLGPGGDRIVHIIGTMTCSGRLGTHGARRGDLVRSGDDCFSVVFNSALRRAGFECEMGAQTYTHM